MTDHGLTVEPVDPTVCVAAGYEYQQHEPWPFCYACSRCGRPLNDDGKAKQ